MFPPTSLLHQCFGVGIKTAQGLEENAVADNQYGNDGYSLGENRLKTGVVLKNPAIKKGPGQKLQQRVNVQQEKVGVSEHRQPPRYDLGNQGNYNIRPDHSDLFRNPFEFPE